MSNDRDNATALAEAFYGDLRKLCRAETVRELRKAVIQRFPRLTRQEWQRGRAIALELERADMTFTQMRSLPPLPLLKIRRRRAETDPRQGELPLNQVRAK
jgi:hypothetical protein